MSLSPSRTRNLSTNMSSLCILFSDLFISKTYTIKHLLISFTCDLFWEVVSAQSRGKRLGTTRKSIPRSEINQSIETLTDGGVSEHNLFRPKKNMNSYIWFPCPKEDNIVNPYIKNLVQQWESEMNLILEIFIGSSISQATLFVSYLSRFKSLRIFGCKM